MLVRLPQEIGDLIFHFSFYFKNMRFHCTGIYLNQ